MNPLEIDKAHIWHPFTPLVTDSDPVLIESAEGVYLHTKDGRKVIDAISSWWVNIHGHSNKAIAEAVYKQASTMEHVIFAQFTHPPAIELAKNLMTILPKNQEKIFFSDNGSTTIEVALKMALQFWYNQGHTNKTKVIAFEGAYHGDTFGAMAVGARSGFTRPFFPFLFDVHYLDLPTPDNFEEVLQKLENLCLEEDTAAFIFEPLVQGAGGMRMYAPEHLNRMIQLAQSKGIICIADEVMTGFGRTGKLFATDHIEANPDIICVSKGITGGSMPLGITACSQKIVDAFESDELSKALLHGHSYTGNPMACAAANASFGLLMDPSCQAARTMIHEEHTAFAQKLEQLDNVTNIRVTGTICAFDIAGHGNTSYDNDLRKKIFPYFLEHNILLRPLGNVMYIMPPYVITKEELNLIYDRILEFLNTLG